MAEIYPVGARCWVKEIQPVDMFKERAKKAGLALVQFDDAAPKPTTGYVIAVGNDPLIQEMVREGDLIFFSKYAGEYVHVKEEKLRVILLNEITSVARGTPEELKALEAPPED